MFLWLMIIYMHACSSSADSESKSRPRVVQVQSKQAEHVHAFLTDITSDIRLDNKLGLKCLDWREAQPLARVDYDVELHVRHLRTQSIW